nr:serine/threonine-protein kinase [Pseudenhygromyxa sp. WMMC2535]
MIANVGHGGLGHVWKAHDPHLDRVVALKLLRAQALRQSPRARDQLLAEAASMGRLTHPNIVRVYDLGDADGELYVAMEFIEGLTLRSWQAQQNPDWRTLLRIYLQAGEGLAGAHAEGLVHGDFKPDNVLIGDDGRVLVSDFAVAQHLSRAQASLAGSGRSSGREAARLIDEESWPEAAEQTPFETSLGAHALPIMGTPAYMAPEQLDGEIADALADQFAFCVALWEALFGVRPFNGRTRAQLREAIAAGRPRPPSAATRLPKRLLAILQRGLAEDPAQRYPSLGALLHELDALASRRRRWLLGAGLSAVLIAGITGVAFGLSVEPEPWECPVDETYPYLGWLDDARAALSARLREDPGALDAAALDAVVGRLDTFAARWDEARTQTCTELEREGDEGMSAFHDRALCMYAAGGTFKSFLEILMAEGGQPRLVARPVVAELPDPRRCVIDISDPQRAPPPKRARLDPEQRLRLAQARALKHSARLDAALAMIDELGAEDPPSASVELDHGQLLSRLGDTRAAIQVLERASALAELDNNLQVEVLTARHIAELLIELDEDPERGLGWAERSALLAARINEPRERLASELLRGDASLRLGEGARAIEIQQAAEQTAVAALGPDDPTLWLAAEHLARTHAELGHRDAAIEQLERAIALRTLELGEGHLELAALRVRGGRYLALVGAREQARALIAEGHAELDEQLGRGHVYSRRSARALARRLYAEGLDPDAEALLAGDEHPDALLLRARAALDHAEFEGARALVEALRASLDAGLHPREDRLHIAALELDGRLAALAGDARGLAQARADAAAILALTADGGRRRDRPRGLALELDAAMRAGEPVEQHRHRLAQALAEIPGLAPELRAWARVLLWRSAPDSQRADGLAAARAALEHAYAPTHPARVDFEG